MAFSPLHVSAVRGRVEDVEELVKKHGVDPLTTLHVTPLMRASEAGREDTAKTLITLGADVNANDKGGWTPLMYAGSQGHTNIVNLLVASGANVNATSKIGWNALMYAANEGKRDSMSVLVSAGSDMSGEAAGSVTAADLALANDHLDCAQMLDPSLGETDTNSSATSDQGGRPLLSSSSHDVDSAFLSTPRPSDVGLEADPVVAAGKSTISAETTSKSVDDPRKLHVTNTLNVWEGWTSIAAAAGSGDVAAIRAMSKDPSFDPNIRGEHSWTPLMWAADAGKHKVALQLLKFGAKTELASDNGWTPLLFASARGFHNLVAILLHSGAAHSHADLMGVTPLMLAAGGDHAAVVEQLLEAGAHPNQQSSHGLTALMGSIFYEAIDCMTLLLNHGADVRVNATAGPFAHKNAAIIAYNSPNEELKELFSQAEPGAFSEVESGLAALEIERRAKEANSCMGRMKRFFSRKSATPAPVVDRAAIKAGSDAGDDSEGGGGKEGDEGAPAGGSQAAAEPDRSLADFEEDVDPEPLPEVLTREDEDHPHVNPMLSRGVIKSARGSPVLGPSTGPSTSSVPAVESAGSDTAASAGASAGEASSDVAASATVGSSADAGTDAADAGANATPIDPISVTLTLSADPAVDANA